MDAQRFDRLTRALTEAGTRRGLLGVLATLPVLGGLVALFAPEETNAKGRRKRRKKAHKHGKGRRRKHHNLQKCKPKSKAKTCAGKCGPVKNNCQKTVDCGSCGSEVCSTAADCAPAGDACVNDQCVCGSGAPCRGGSPTCCGAPGVCTDTQTDPDHCGQCDQRCSGSTPGCAGGTCVPCSSNTPCADGCCQDDFTCGPTCRVFATSTVSTGDLGGMQGADETCQMLAGDAGLVGGYLAWLSDGANSPAVGRFPLAGSPTVGPYVLVGDPAVTIAADWEALTNRSTCDTLGSGACLDHPIDRDETGTPVAAPLTAWTGTDRFGGSLAENVTCGQWSSGTTGDGGFGDITRADARWTESGLSGCNASRRLYCFQQG